MSIINKLLKPVSESESIRVMTVGSSALVPVVTDAQTDSEVPQTKSTFNQADSGAACIASVSECDSVETKGKAKKSAVSKVSIESFFAAKGLDIRLDPKSPCIAPVEKLAFLIASNYNLCKSFIKYLRDIVLHKDFHVHYSVSELTDIEKAAVLDMAGVFGQYGIISNLYFNKYTGVINGFFSSAPRVINLINGNFLEYYGRAVVERVVKEKAEMYATDYEVYSNALVTVDGKEIELDLVFRVGDNVFWSEIKSGAFSEFDKYRRRGVSMGVNPYRHIMLVAETEREQTETISWLYECYVANVENFKDKVAEMIDNAFSGGLI